MDKRMGITKRLNFENIFLFLFLVLFPFGQIIRIGIIQPLDVVAGLAAFWAVYKKFEKPAFVKNLNQFLFFAIVSWFLSLFFFQQTQVLYGFLYLVRLSIYFYFGIYVWNFTKTKENKNLLFDSLLVIAIVAAFLGWVQFFTVPDLKPFFVLGWDKHLFRLVGTFLDPAFLGLIIVFGIILSFLKFVELKSKTYLFITIFFLISLAFTYSRASYLAFLVAAMVMGFYKKAFKQLFALCVALIFIVLILPTARNHSIELLRLFSAIARIDNYKTTLQIFSKSPVFGVGYDNMCIAYQKYIGEQSFASHACSGSDSSLLFVLATTGVTGLMVFVFNIFVIQKQIPKNKNYLILATSFIALLVHSIFSNSMFYPWIMGWMIILLAEV